MVGSQGCGSVTIHGTPARLQLTNRRFFSGRPENVRAVRARAMAIGHGERGRRVGPESVARIGAPDVGAEGTAEAPTVFAASLSRTSSRCTSTRSPSMIVCAARSTPPNSRKRPAPIGASPDTCHCGRGRVEHSAAQPRSQPSGREVPRKAREHADRARGGDRRSGKAAHLRTRVDNSIARVRATWRRQTIALRNRVSNYSPPLYGAPPTSDHRKVHGPAGRPDEKTPRT